MNAHTISKRLTILLIVLSIAGTIRGSHQQSNATSLPPGNWTLSCGPSRTRGEVVDLYSVGTDAAKGLTVTEVALENRSNQDVVAVKIGWKESGTSVEILAILITRPGSRR